MCGICGIVSFENGRAPKLDIVKNMCQTILHRGPDDEGFYSDENAAIGMRRLSIIDVAGGTQPIFNEDRTICAIQNGEIYNFKEIRQELEKRGHQFTTNSDTEVIVHAYEEYGSEFPKKLNGMFAIAIWDICKKRLILVRDRLGQKPLYFLSNKSEFAFGSEIKCLRCTDSFSSELNTRAILNYFTLGYVNEPHSVYRDIRKLPPASVTVVENGNVDVSSYWQLPKEIDTQLTYDEAIHRVKDTISDSVKLRMISDVPLGAFLSGGLDSSIVVAEMAKVSPTPIKTFFIDFAEESHSERDFARSVAKEFSTDHYELVAKPSATDLIEELVNSFDEPFSDASAIPTFMVSKLTRQHVTVALAGDGGDESFGGYSRYQRILNRTDMSTFRKILAPVSWTSNYFPAYVPGRRYFGSLQFGNDALYAGGLNETEARRLLSRKFLANQHQSVSSELWSPLGTANSDKLQKYSQFDIHWYLPGDILTKVDRMSMANSLEVRAPFLDYRLVELAASMPHEWKIENQTSKKILKSAYKQQLPKSVMAQRKRGFSIPLADWLRNDLRPLVEDMCADPIITESGIFNAIEVRKMVKEHFGEYRSRASQIWRLLFFIQWLKMQPNSITRTAAN